MKHEKTYLLTDGCMWEQNKRNNTNHPHAIEVVDTETGEIRFIRSGSRIAFVEGEITDLRTQEAYNKKTTNPPMSRYTQNKLLRAKVQRGGTAKK